MSAINRLKISKREFAWCQAVIARAAGGRCQHCGKAERLDAAHLKPRKLYPAIAWDPDNGIALCRSCHTAFDHANGDRPSGRPPGFRHSEETKAKIGAASKIDKNRPAVKRALSARAKAQWARQGRKTKAANCPICNTPLKPRQVYARMTFCSLACAYKGRRPSRVSQH
jgi:hypothetical protein